MKILYVGRSCHIGGVPNVRLRAAMGLIDKKHEIHLLAQGGPMAGEFKKAGVRLHLTGPTPFNRLHLAWLLKRERFDVVHADNAAAGDDVLAVFKLSGLKETRRPAFIVAIHGLFSSKVTVTPCLPLSDCALVFDSSTTQRLRQFKGMANHPIKMVRRPVQAHDIKTYESLVATPKHSPHFVFVSRLSKSKGLGAKATIAAIEELQKEWPDIQLTIVGEGSQRKELKQLADACNARSQREVVRMVGAVKEPFPLMATATGVIGTAMVAMEALYHGIPIVAAGYQGYGTITCDNLDEAIECNFGDAVLEPRPVTKELILEGLLHILQNSDKCQTESEMQYISARIRQEHSVDTVSSELEQIYRETIASREDRKKTLSRSAE